MYPIIFVAARYFHAAPTPSALSVIYDSLFGTCFANILKTSESEVLSFANILKISESEVLKHSVSVLHPVKLQGSNNIMPAAEVVTILAYGCTNNRQPL